MIATTTSSTPHLTPSPEKAITLALTLAQAERAIHEFASNQVDAIVDTDGKAYLLRPAQERLRTDARRMKAILDCSADVITVVNRGGLILSTSQAAHRVLGYAPEELIGKSFFEFIHDEDLPNVHFAWFGVIERFRENTNVHFRHLTHDGSYRLLEASLGLLQEGSSVSVVFILRPVDRSIPAHIEHAVSRALAMPPTEVERECILLSHGRRIPLMGADLGLNGPESTSSELSV